MLVDETVLNDIILWYLTMGYFISFLCFKNVNIFIPNVLKLLTHVCMVVRI